MANFDTFAAQLLRHKAIHSVIDMGDGTCLLVEKLMFHWTVKRSVIGDHTSYEDRWCYETQVVAEAAVQEWRSRSWEGEPIGWHRHPPTGRRRPNGNPAEEHIEW